jgi:hypothetical protein
VLSREVSYFIILLSVEWGFIQTRLGDVLNDADRLESSSVNESDGGEECDAILTSMRRARRRSARPLIESWVGKTEDDPMAIDDVMAEDERALTGGKTIPLVRLTINGH